MVRYTFLRELRLLTPKDFKTVFDNPIRASSPSLTVLARDNSLNHPRLGLVVPKKALHKAVSRNRIKRLIRNTFRLNQNDLPYLDYVVIAKNPIDKMLNIEIIELFENLCKVIYRCYKK